ncbi:MAG TPA: anti-anti-sigma factor [Desulfobulbus sp.]|nr:anti-anti-sigma factor [Desulfobulbus sp.]
MQAFSLFSLGGVLLVSVEEDIDDDGLRDLVARVSFRVSRETIAGVIVDLHHFEVMDSHFAGQLQALARVLRLLQARMVVVGLCVPVVMTLLDFGISLPEMEFALDVEQALVRLQEAGPDQGNGP